MNRWAELIKSWSEFQRSSIGDVEKVINNGRSVRVEKGIDLEFKVPGSKFIK